MTAFLAPHVHLARLGNDLVFLDVLADRYMCAPDLGEHAVVDDRRRLDGLRPTDLEAFKAAGLLDGKPSWSPPPPPLPNQGLDATDAAVKVIDQIRFAAALIDLTVCYPGRPFARLLRNVRPPLGEVRDPSGQEILRLARAFRQLVVFAPISRKCLVRSFLLMRFLDRAGHSAQWVFGVRTWPFGAHCWVQSGDVVLDDAPERLAPYQPIFCV